MDLYRKASLNENIDEQSVAADITSTGYQVFEDFESYESLPNLDAEIKENVFS